LTAGDSTKKPNQDLLSLLHSFGLYAVLMITE
jgi:hypothetical protein